MLKLLPECEVKDYKVQSRPPVTSYSFLEYSTCVFKRILTSLKIQNWGDSVVQPALELNRGGEKVLNQPWCATSRNAERGCFQSIHHLYI
ncbi:uncharacterized protein Bfra_007223 [Botrytis fragariae]|uniref:Uncharacterized protein n=1 Tax=Botrytis fragariae TaxID=1964551 RepID=A0A8H6AHU0_9HELO|nr:uncharacterized protein Bfra_007223 [Botrytis fragariae]KAF5868028.1 hypothetical protein Bfra_007223 [Botrytis fragariae]